MNVEELQNPFREWRKFVNGITQLAGGPYNDAECAGRAQAVGVVKVEDRSRGYAGKFQR